MIFIYNCWLNPVMNHYEFLTSFGFQRQSQKQIYNNQFNSNLLEIITPLYTQTLMKYSSPVRWNV